MSNSTVEPNAQSKPAAMWREIKCQSLSSDLQITWHLLIQAHLNEAYNANPGNVINRNLL